MMRLGKAVLNRLTKVFERVRGQHVLKPIQVRLVSPSDVISSAKFLARQEAYSSSCESLSFKKISKSFMVSFSLQCSARRTKFRRAANK
jgi:hypothetical protein